MKHRQLRHQAAAAAWAALASTNAVAQSPASPAPTESTSPETPVTRLSTIVVTPARSAEPLSETLGDNSVIDRAELDTIPNATLAEALGRQHAVEFVNYGGPQTVSTINMRGTNSNQSLVLIDGLRINNATTGLPPLNAIPLNSVERIEIVRGTGASLYGADAIGGVINVITRSELDRPFSAFANAGVGTYGTTQYDAGFSGASDGWIYSLYGGYGQSAGFNATTPSNYYYNPDQDSYYRSNVGGQLGYTWKPGQTLTFQTFQSRVNGGYDMGQPYFNDRGIQVLSTNMLTSRNVLSELWTSTLRASYSLDSYQTINAPASLVPSNPVDGQQHFNTRQSQYTWQNDLKFSPTQLVTLGVERLDQSVDANLSDSGYPQPGFVNYQQVSRYTNSAFGIYRGNWGPQSLQASVRDDSNSQYGNFVTGSLMYGLDLTRELRATAGVNTGFRAPNFNELYWPVTPYFMGNPNLQPEKSRNIEAGLRYTTDRTELGVVGYYNQIDNLIVNVPLVPTDPASPYAPVNIGHATIQGLTFTGSQLWGKTRLHGSLDLVDPRNADTGQLLPQRAQTVFKGAVDQTVGQLRLTAELYATSARLDSFSGQMLGGYALFNLVAAYPLTSYADILVRWNNVLDKSYTLVQGYATPGSNVFVNLALRM